MSYNIIVKYSEFKKWLKEQGCTFEEGKGHGKGSHLTVYHNDKSTHIPYHASKEVRNGTYYAILKQLGLKKGK